MELWIRSQDKERLLKLNDIFANANYCIADGETYGYRMFANGEFFLGTYETKERCIEILDEIQKLLKPSVIYRKYHNEIKDGKNNLEFTLEMTPDNESIDIIQPTTIVYEMPKE